MCCITEDTSAPTIGTVSWLWTASSVFTKGCQHLQGPWRLPGLNLRPGRGNNLRNSSYVGRFTFKKIALKALRKSKNKRLVLAGLLLSVTAATQRELRVLIAGPAGTGKTILA